jgi:hypothetical protein
MVTHYVGKGVRIKFFVECCDQEKPKKKAARELFFGSAKVAVAVAGQAFVIALSGSLNISNAQRWPNLRESHQGLLNLARKLGML